MQKRNLLHRSLLFLLLSLVIINTNAQTGLSFQGVARTSNNVILASQSITVKFSILQGSTTGTVEYVETRKVNTNAQGLFTAVIGDTGTISKTGNFSTINWKLTPKFLKIEMDPAAGTNFVTMGTTQFQFVAYAQFAKSVDADNIVGIVPVTLGGTGVNSLTGLKTALAVDKVNNTADADKPISASTQTALNLKLNTTDSIKFLKSVDTIKYVKKAFVDSALITKVSSTGNVATATTATSAATAATATKLTTARNINGVSFDGTADITIIANAGTLTGTSLKSSITESSLTSVGTLTNLTVTNPIVGSITGNAATATLAGNITATTNTTLTTLSSLTSVGTLTNLNVTNPIVGSITGNAATATTATSAGTASTATTATTATKLATSRNINGVSFDGSADITITANAGTLTGTSLKSTITESSLTSVGTLTSATISGKVIVGTASATVSSAVFEANSTKQGLLPPRMTYSQKMAISSPVAGLTIWCSNCGTSGQMQVYNGTDWTDMIGGTSLTANPEITSTAPTNIASTSATAGGEITSNGGNIITARGVVWGISANPTIALSTKTTLTGTTGSFSSSITGLTINTQYYVRAYATTSLGTTYGTQHAFMTIGLPVVASTTTVTNITATTASSGGDITSGGGGTITARGICWGTSANPTTSNSFSTVAGTTGTYTSTMTSLTSGTLYYVRAYATNGAGTSYGTQKSFTTKSLPIVSTTTVTSITSTTATSGGNLTNDGGLTITGKGVCWSTSPNPTTADSKTDNGVTAGTYASNLTGLSPSTLYYVRAYATNTAGTAYGLQVSFTTRVPPPADVTSATGKIWLDRNLGASRVATSSTDASAFGDLYQWGRGTDGHESRTSTKTNGIVTTNTPGDALFIFSSSFYLFDWRSPQNGNLWQGVSGINNPCPTGYRLPTEAEWTEEIASWSSANADGAYASPLKLPRNGRFRDYSNGDIPPTVIGDPGYYWSSTVTGPDGSFTGNNAKYMRINSSVAQISIFPRASGLSVRCIKN
jgi:uncharacterized protein (TIGR02145 family)